jgi:hypothetical protein
MSTAIDGNISSCSDHSIKSIQTWRLLVAICTREQAEQLVNYNHHVVNVNGRPDVLHHAEKHPRAPEEKNA